MTRDRWKKGERRERGMGDMVQQEKDQQEGLSGTPQPQDGRTHIVFAVDISPGSDQQVHRLQLV